MKVIKMEKERLHMTFEITGVVLDAP